MSQLEWIRTADRPTLKLWLFDDADNLIDFSTGSPTFTFRVGNLGQPALIEKTSGITGAAGSGTAPDGVPNVVISPTAGEFDIPPGAYAGQLTVTTSGLDRPFDISCKVKDAILPKT